MLEIRILVKDMEQGQKGTYETLKHFLTYMWIKTSISMNIW